MEKKEKEKRWVDQSVYHLARVIIVPKIIQNQREKKGLKERNK